jgi:hypothetical protein
MASLLTPDQVRAVIKAITDVAMISNPPSNSYTENNQKSERPTSPSNSSDIYNTVVGKLCNNNPCGGEDKDLNISKLTGHTPSMLTPHFIPMVPFGTVVSGTESIDLSENSVLDNGANTTSCNLLQKAVKENSIKIDTDTSEEVESVVNAAWTASENIDSKNRKLCDCKSTKCLLKDSVDLNLSNTPQNRKPFNDLKKNDPHACSFSSSTKPEGVGGATSFYSSSPFVPNRSKIKKLNIKTNTDVMSFPTDRSLSPILSPSDSFPKITSKYSRSSRFIGSEIKSNRKTTDLNDKSNPELSSRFRLKNFLFSARGAEHKISTLITNRSYSADYARVRKTLMIEKDKDLDVTRLVGSKMEEKDLNIHSKNLKEKEKLCENSVDGLSGDCDNTETLTEYEVDDYFSNNKNSNKNVKEKKISEIGKSKYKKKTKESKDKQKGRKTDENKEKQKEMCLESNKNSTENIKPNVNVVVNSVNESNNIIPENCPLNSENLLEIKKKKKCCVIL